MGKSTNLSGKLSTNYLTQFTLNEWGLPRSDLPCLTSSKTMTILYSLIVTTIISIRLLLPVGHIDPPTPDWWDESLADYEERITAK